jgi:broad specificity phosphatase PhoE
MRHGEKLIKTGQKPKCGRFDSELSPIGINQAFLSGQKFIEQLKKYFPDISSSDISIISSPYMRTLQTTSHFLRGIATQNFFSDNIDNIYNISIENGVREILNKDKLKGEEVPKDFLNFLNNPNYKDFDEEIKKLKLNVLKNYEFSTEKESRDECFVRCKKYVDECLVNYDKNNDYKVIVIISHAGPIQFMMRALGYNVENVQKILFCEQYYFDISEGIKNAKFIEKIIINEFN